MKMIFVVLALAGGCQKQIDDGEPEVDAALGSAGCPAYVVPLETDLMTPAVSFKSSVMPVFNHSCGSSACHGSSDSPQGGLFLGSEAAAGADAATVYAGLVGQASGELPTMMFVTAKTPETSYLMHKLDGDQCLYQTSCTSGNCMHSMPSDSDETLPTSTRDTVRRWIAQGAPSN